MIVEAVDAVERAAFLALQFAAVAGEVDRSGRFPQEHVVAIREAGLLGLAVPEKLGGEGLGLAACADVLRTLSRGDGGTALGLAMHLMVTGSMAQGGEDWPGAAWERMARGAASGAVITNRVASEISGGSPARGGLPQTRLEPTADGWSLTGRKDWATWAPALTHPLITARLDSADGPAVAQVVVPLDQPGVTRLAEAGGVGLRSAANGALVFERVPLDRDALLYVRRAGGPPPRTAGVLAWFRLCTTAVYVGVAEAARDAVADFTRNRRPNGREEPISAIPGVRLRLGRIDADVRAAGMLLAAAAQRIDAAAAAGVDPTACAADVSVAKVQATELAWSACEQALRLAGGNALQGGALPLERLARDVRGGLVHPPTEDAVHTDLGAALADA